MLCDRCKKETATTYYKQTVNGVTTQQHLCGRCAEELGLNGSSFSNIFTGMFGMRSAESAQGTRCPGCGMTYGEIAHGGKTGCAQCYQTFHLMLEGTLKKIHGKTKHVGRTPAGKMEKDDVQNKIDELKGKMTKAIEEQAFEEAARLRDEIKELEGKKNV